MYQCEVLMCGTWVTLPSRHQSLTGAFYRAMHATSTDAQIPLEKARMFFEHGYIYFSRKHGQRVRVDVQMETRKDIEAAAQTCTGWRMMWPVFGTSQTPSNEEPPRVPTTHRGVDTVTYPPGWEQWSGVDRVMFYLGLNHFRKGLDAPRYPETLSYLTGWGWEA